MSDDGEHVSIDQDKIRRAREIQNARNSSQKPKASKPICKIIFDVPYYFCGDCKAMLNMYSTKAKFCSQCGQVVQWGKYDSKGI